LTIRVDSLVSYAVLTLVIGLSKEEPCKSRATT